MLIGTDSLSLSHYAYVYALFNRTWLLTLMSRCMLVSTGPLLRGRALVLLPALSRFKSRSPRSICGNFLGQETPTCSWWSCWMAVDVNGLWYRWTIYHFFDLFCPRLQSKNTQFRWATTIYNRFLSVVGYFPIVIIIICFGKCQISKNGDCIISHYGYDHLYKAVKDLRNLIILTITVECIRLCMDL